jgi:hypothetical protein
MLTGKRYDTLYDEYEAERVQGFSISDDDLHNPIGDVIEENLPNEPVEQPAEDTTDITQTNSSEIEPSDKKMQASLKALDMLEKELLTEKVALAVIGTHEQSYSVAPDVRIKALELVEAGKLSEWGLVGILGV